MTNLINNQPTCGYVTASGPCILPRTHVTGIGLPGERGHVSSVSDATALTTWLATASKVYANTAATKPEAPDGSIHTADLVSVVNIHSERNNWCESVIGLLNDIDLRVRDGKRYDSREHGWMGPRVELTERTPQFVTKDAVSRALTKARNVADDDDFDALATELKDRWGIEPEPEYNDTYIVTFRLTADDLRRDDYKWDSEDGLKEAIDEYVRDNEYVLATIPDPNRPGNTPQEPQVPCTCRAFTEGGGHSHGCHYGAGNPAVAQK